MNAVDTNVLFYVHDPRDAAKRLTAATLVKSLTDGVLFMAGRMRVTRGESQA